MITAIADAIVTALNADESWTPEFTAVRVLAPEIAMKDAATLTVLVAPQRRTIVPAHRTMDQYDVDIDVAVIQRLSAIDNATVDPLIAFIEAIETFLRRKDMSTGKWISAEHRVIYDPARLRQDSLFISVLTETYRVFE